MSNPDTWLAEQRERLIAELSSSAEADGILLPGQQIVFTLQIEEVPTVVAATEISRILGLPIPRFFTKERCERFPEFRDFSTRIHNQLYGKDGSREHHPEEFLTTVGDIFELGARGLARRKNVGRKTIEGIKKILEEEGVSLPD